MDEDSQRPEYVRQDFHVHTCYSPCCKHKERNTPDQIVRQAEADGIKVLGFADHIFTHRDGRTVPPFYEPSTRQVLDTLRADLGRIDTEVELLLSVEADLVAEDWISIDERTAAELDYVLLAATHFHLDGVEKPKSSDPRDVAEHALKFFRIAVDSNLADIVAHPLIVLGVTDEELRRIHDCITDSDLVEILQAAADKHVAMELNVETVGKAEWSDRRLGQFFHLCQQYGVKIAGGTDAHDRDSLRMIFNLEQAAHKFHLTPQDFITSGELCARHLERMDSSRR